MSIPTPSFFKIRVILLIISFLVFCFLVGAVKNAFADYEVGLLHFRMVILVMKKLLKHGMVRLCRKLETHLLVLILTIGSLKPADSYYNGWLYKFAYYDSTTEHVTGMLIEGIYKRICCAMYIAWNRETL